MISGGFFEAPTGNLKNDFGFGEFGLRERRASSTQESRKGRESEGLFRPDQFFGDPKRSSEVTFSW